MAKSKLFKATEIETFTKPGRYFDGDGLHLLVKEGGARSWVLRFMLGGKRRELGLGGYPKVTLAKARKQAEVARNALFEDRDPIAEKRRVIGLTFSEAVEKYLAAKLSEFRNEKHKRQWRATLDTYAGPVIGRKQVPDISVQDVLRVLHPIWNTKTVTASRLRGRIESVLAWATVCGFRSGDNPARWSGNLKELLPKPNSLADRENQPSLALSDLAAWFASLHQREGFAARAVEFLAMTATRSGEVRGATWSEIDVKAGLWIIPASRMKMKREHRVPLSESALELLRSLPRLEGSDMLFPATRGGALSDMSLSAVMRRMQESEVNAGNKGWLDPRSGRPAVPHGLRSSFRVWAAERGYDRDMAELQLAHRVGTEVERAYQRSDMLERRRVMMADWANFLAGRESEKVVRLRRSDG